MLRYKFQNYWIMPLFLKQLGGGGACNISIFLKNANILNFFPFWMETNSNVSQLNRNSVFQTASVSICP